MDRRSFLKLLLSLPMLGVAGAFMSPSLRYLRPTLGPLTASKIDTKNKPFTEWVGEGGLIAKPDKPEKERDVRFKVSDFAKPWDVQTFTFGQRSTEYTANGFQATRIPAFAIRLPEDKDGKPDFYVISRICPHMGCVFNYLQDPVEAANYNYPQAKDPLFACPCHLSVFDPLQTQDDGKGKLIPGKVVSGPAPRPPRQFTWAIEGDDLVIQEAESGGIS
ncbi:MAG: ubiquinol-cytochrome c reductase iron-sulfur subunit [Vampirovibrionales bacterium]|nr:ubiquinol-cytochrome c reductase iron-sulfur subunit [Vampirovibrionales bacterium]